MRKDEKSMMVYESTYGGTWIEDLRGVIEATDGDFKPRLFLVQEWLGPGDGKPYAVRYGPRRVIERFASCRLLLAVESPDGRFSFAEPERAPNRDGIPEWDLMRLLRTRFGLKCRAISGDAEMQRMAEMGCRWGSWQHYIDLHPQLLSEYGVFTVEHSDWDGMKMYNDSLSLSAGALTVTRSGARFPVEQLGLRWAEKPYWFEPAFRELVRGALASPHTLSWERLTELLRARLSEKDLAGVLWQCSFSRKKT